MDRERYRIGDLLIDVGAASITRRGEEISLPPLSFRLLVALIRYAPDVVSSERLIDEVWKGVAVSDETLTQRVALLRRALGEDGRRPTYLRSIRGRGYRLIPAVVAPGESPALETRLAAQPDRVVRPGVHHGVRAGTRWLLASAVSLAVVAVTIVPRITSPERRSSQPTRTALPTPDELASRGDFYLARQRASDNELAVEIYQRALEKEPAHRAALVGLSISLSQGVTKFNQPSQRSEVALSLADRALELDPRDPAAHQARAFALDSRGRVSAALAGYQRAAGLDPELGAALSSAAYLLYVKGHLADALEANLRAAAHPDASNYREVQMGLTLAALGFDRDAEIWLERALELRPDNVFAGASLAQVALQHGRPGEAAEIAHIAISRGVRRPELHMTLGHVALATGDRDAAARHYRRARAVNARLGYAETRLLILDRVREGATQEILERYETSVAAARRAREDGDEWPDSVLDEALLHTAFGHPRRALEALDVAIDLGYRNADWLMRDPMFGPLRTDAGFGRRVEWIRAAVRAERRKVLDAAWLPVDLIHHG